MSNTPAAPQADPVGEVQIEPDYWNRGHFHEGRRKVVRVIGDLESLPVGTKLYAAPAAPAQEPQQPDPCPQCRPGVVCRTPKCGRLRAKAAASSPAVQPTEAVAELVQGLEAIVASWDNPDWFVNLSAAMPRARALIAKHGQPQGGK